MAIKLKIKIGKRTAFFETGNIILPIGNAVVGQKMKVIRPKRVPIKAGNTQVIVEVRDNKAELTKTAHEIFISTFRDPNPNSNQRKAHP